MKSLNETKDIGSCNFFLFFNHLKNHNLIKIIKLVEFDVIIETGICLEWNE